MTLLSSACFIWIMVSYTRAENFGSLEQIKSLMETNNSFIEGLENFVSQCHDHTVELPVEFCNSVRYADLVKAKLSESRRVPSIDSYVVRSLSPQVVGSDSSDYFVLFESKIVKNM